MAARRHALRLTARALEQRLNADTSDYAGPQLACACGRLARYAGRREKSFIALLGRGWDRCAHARFGVGGPGGQASRWIREQLVK